MTTQETDRVTTGVSGPGDAKVPGLALRARLSRFVRDNSIAVIIGILLIWLVAAPLYFLLRMSFSSGSPIDMGDPTLSNYRSALSHPMSVTAIRNTFVYSLGVSSLSLVIAVMAAWLIERTDLPGRNLAWIAMLAPIAIPGMLSAMSWILLLAPEIGMINGMTRSFFELFGVDLGSRGPFNIYSMAGMIFVEGTRGATTLFLMIVGAFRLMDPALEEAASMSGAGRMQTLRKVTLPLMLPALLAAIVYSFLGNLQDFDTPMLLGFPANIYILPTLIYFVAYISPIPSWGLGAAYASLFLVLLAVMTVLYYKVVIKNSRKFASLGGKAYRPRRIGLGKWRWPAAFSFFVFFMISVGLPLLVLMWSALLPTYEAPSIDALSRVSLANFATLLDDQRTISAFWNTVQLAVGTATLGMGIAFVVSWAVVRVKVKGALLMDGMAFAPNAIPTIAIGIGLVMLYLSPAARWTQLYGTIFVLMVGLVVNYMAFATRLSNGAMAQLSAELEEQSWVAGRGKFFTLVRITTPLLMPTFLAGWIWIAAHAARNLTLPLLLGSRRDEVLAQRLFEVWSVRGDLPYASTIGVVFMLILIVLAFAARRVITKGFTAD